MSLEIGFAFIIEYEDPPHIWFVASDGSEHGDVLLLNFTTQHESSDTTCIVDPGEYSGLSHTSVVSYRHSRIESVGHIETLLLRKQAMSRPRVPSKIIERAQQGALKSQYVSPNKRRLITGAAG